MNGRQVDHQKAIDREMLLQEAAHANGSVSPRPLPGDTICSTSGKRDNTPQLTAEDEFSQPVEAALLPRIRRPAPRIAFKAKGKISFLDLTEIVAVQAEGNYISLRHRPSPSLVRGSLSSMAEKLRPYGFIRIHRSVIVNVSAVQEIQPLPTGEYRLRVKGGGEYLVTRRYKDNLRDLAQLWVGSGRLCG